MGNLGDAIAIIIFTPLFESVCYPVIARLKGSPLRIGQKLIAGLLVAGSANLFASWMEVRRRAAPLMCWEETSKCAPLGIHMRDVSAMWMLVSFGLTGAAEILVNPVLYYMVYAAAPPRVRSLIQGFCLFFQGAVSGAFTAVVTDMLFPNDLDTGHLEIYYFANVIIALVGVVLYFLITRCCSNGEDLNETVRDDEVDVLEHDYSHRPGSVNSETLAAPERLAA